MRISERLCLASANDVHNENAHRNMKMGKKLQQSFIKLDNDINSIRRK